MVHALVRALLLAVATVGAHALDNGLGARPGLGWNSDYCTNCTKKPSGGGLGSGGFGGETFVKRIAEYFHAAKQPAAGGATLQQLGFHYVNMDAS